MDNIPGRVVVANVPLPNTGEFYAVAVPENTVHFTVQTASGQPFHLQIGNTGSTYPNTTYFTVRAGGTYYEQGIRFNGFLGIKSSAPDDIAEAVFWSV